MKLPRALVRLDGVDYHVVVVMHGPVDEECFAFEVRANGKTIIHPHKHHYHTAEYALQRGKTWVSVYHVQTQNRKPAEEREKPLSGKQKKKKKYLDKLKSAQKG